MTEIEWVKYAYNDLAVAIREMSAVRNPRLKSFEIAGRLGLSKFHV